MFKHGRLATYEQLGILSFQESFRKTIRIARFYYRREELHCHILVHVFEVMSTKSGDYAAVAEDIKKLLHQPEYDDGSAGPVLGTTL